jgi:hypothetical protein
MDCASANIQLFGTPSCSWLSVPGESGWPDGHFRKPSGHSHRVSAVAAIRPFVEACAIGSTPGAACNIAET